MAAGPAAGTRTDPLPTGPAAVRSALRPAPPWNPPSPPRSTRGRRPSTAFVLSGGASLGALQVGMLRALYERGISPDLLVGTSAGAINAAFLASRPPTVQTVKALAEIWRSLHRQDVFPIHPPTLIGGLASQRDHLVPDRSLRRLIARHLELRRLEEARVPLHLVCFDLLNGEEVRLSDGPVEDAVLATAAIPGVLPPVPWCGRLLVDGGVVNNTPISHAIELGAERIYVLPTEDPTCRALPVPPREALDAVVHAFTLMVEARLQHDLGSYASEAELIVLPAVNAGRVQPTDFDHADQLMAAALTAARTALDSVPAPAPIAA